MSLLIEYIRCPLRSYTFSVRRFRNFRAERICLFSGGGAIRDTPAERQLTKQSK
jgi:hypothetical protein